MIELVVLAIAAAFNILLGLTVYLNNPKSATNKFFLGLTTTFATWTMVNYVSLHPIIFQQLYWARLVLFFAALLNFFVLHAITTFPASSITSFRLFRNTLIFTAFVMLLALTPAMFKSLSITPSGVSPVPGPGIVLLLIHTVGFIGYSILYLIKRLRTTTGITHAQYKIIFAGIVISFSLIIFTNFLLVTFFRVTSLLPLSSLFSIIFSGFFAYAIVRHQFLDIRTIVARSVGYLLLIVFFSGLYGLILYTLSLIFFQESPISDSALIVFTAFAILVGLTFQSFRRGFDKYSNKIFFRDAYDSQVVLNQLSELLARTIKLEEIIHSSLDIMSNSIKPEHITFVVLDEDNNIYRQINRNGEISVRKINEALQKGGSQITTTSELEAGDIKREMSKQDVEMAIKLTTQDELVGYLLLGAKKSGNIFSSQDLKLLTIIANELSIALQNARNFEQIQEFNITLQKKIEDATQKLQHSNEKLKALDEAKDEFISMASHQLRTPLTSIKGYVSMVIEGDAGKITPKQEELLTSAFTSSQRMVYLISDLLNVSRLRTGKFVIEAKEVYLPDVVQGEVDQLKEAAKNRKLKFIYKKPKDFPTVMLDETKIRQVIMNFADNAIYYTPAGGKITVELAFDKHSVTYKVIDTGIGVPKEEQHKLFSKFYRAGNAKKARPDGTGLGLFMAKKVVIAQGGAILFETHAGKGSTFGFTFPMSKIAVPNVKKKA